MKITDLSHTNKPLKYIDYNSLYTKNNIASFLEVNLSKYVLTPQHNLNTDVRIPYPGSIKVNKSYKHDPKTGHYYYFTANFSKSPIELFHICFHNGLPPSELGLGIAYIRYNTPGQRQIRLASGQGDTPSHPFFDNINLSQEGCATRRIYELNDRFDTLECSDPWFQKINGEILIALNDFDFRILRTGVSKYNTKYLKYKTKYLKLKKQLNL